MHVSKRYIIFILIVGCSLAMHGCANTRNSGASSGNPEADRRAEERVEGDGASNPTTTLYERIGGTQAIVAIVDDMTARVLDDPRVNFQRKDISTSWLGTEYDTWEPNEQNVANFKKHMVDFIELASGGPARYTGRNIHELHKGMRITNVEFDAFVGDLQASMERLNVNSQEQRDLLAIIETTRKQIVEVRE